MSYSGLLEDLIHDVGGCGRFQWLTAFIGQTGKAIVAISMLAMTFNGQQPDFYCTTDRMHERNGSGSALKYDNECKAKNVSQCDGYIFDESMNTVVNEVSIYVGFFIIR